MKQVSTRQKQSGLTLMELVIALAILAVLSSVVLPLAEVTVQRTKEIELKRSLRIMRGAIDAYKTDFDLAVKQKKIRTSIDDNGYPETLEVLVEGSDWGGLYRFKKKYLRRIPVDPFDEYEQGWGMRSYADDYDTTYWGGDDVYDVFSQSDRTALDGTLYNTW
ncbi:MAG: general secretion pathway protein GspG [Desulfuromonas sp.]|nr:MAG: general secretion pathway protein GspG [Desulfuromonas sp.]